MRILLADDHALIRSGLRAELVDFAPEVEFVEAWDAESVEAQMSGNGDLDLALIDLTMPGMRGVKSIEDLRARHPSVPLIVISAMHAADMAECVLEAGAAGFIPKSAISAVVVQAIRLVLAGGRYVPPELLGTLAGKPRGPATPVHRAPGMPAAGAPPTDGLTMLSPRQREVFELLAKGLSNKHIARALNITEGTVKTHVATIFDVLNVRNRVAAVAEARRLTEGRSDRGV
jgi:DNA-binding NarL/FixJ family response regulator